MSSKTLDPVSHRPRLDTLQRFANGYFSRNPPKVQWCKLEKGVLGQADFPANTIRISPNITAADRGCIVGYEIPYIAKKQFRFKPCESYFLTLLHEIAHFKITKRRKIKPPQEWKRLKRQIIREWPANRQMQSYVAQDFMTQKKGETEEEYLGRLWEFQCYLMTGDSIKDHGAVEEWARTEFERRRKEIAGLIAKSSR